MKVGVGADGRGAGHGIRDARYRIAESGWPWKSDRAFCIRFCRRDAGSTLRSVLPASCRQFGTGAAQSRKRAITGNVGQDISPVPNASQYLNRPPNVEQMRSASTHSGRPGRLFHGVASAGVGVGDEQRLSCIRFCRRDASSTLRSVLPAPCRQFGTGAAQSRKRAITGNVGQDVWPVLEDLTGTCFMSMLAVRHYALA